MAKEKEKTDKPEKKDKDKSEKKVKSDKDKVKKKEKGQVIKIVERRTTEAHVAAQKGEFQRMKMFVDAGININVADKDGATPLHHASLMGHAKIVKLLLKAQAQVDAEDNDGSTPLHNACFAGRTECVTLLLASGANAEAQDSEDGTPLLNACSQGHVECVKALLKRGVVMETPDDRGATCLHYASYYGHEMVVKLLLEKGAKVEKTDFEGATPLHHACANGHLRVLKLLLKQPNINVNEADKSGTTPLHFAAYNNHRACVAELLRHAKENYKVDLRSVMLNCRDKEGSTPLHKSAFRGDAEILTLFLESGADINATDGEGATPLHKAAFKGNNAILRILLERGAKMDIKDNQGGTALYNACYGGFVKCVKLLLEKEGADKMINLTDKDGRSPLHAVACFGHWQCTHLLVENNADLNVKDKDNMTPLHLAAFNGCNLSMNFLIDKGADVKVFNSDGIYPLHYASYKGHITTVYNLIQKGADPNCVDNKRNTPMFYAAARNNWDICAYLAFKDGDIDHQNQEGLTPLSYAVKNHSIDAAITLLERNADPDAKDNRGNTPRKLSKIRNNPMRKVFQAIGKRPFSPQTLAMLSDFRTPQSLKKTERGFSDAQDSGSLDAMISEKLMSVSSPFTEFDFKFDLNDPGEVGENVFAITRRLKQNWTVLNILRMLLLIPDDEMNGRKMWNMIETFINQLVTNEPTQTTKLSFEEFLREWKIRSEPPRMKKLETLSSVESAMLLMFPSAPKLDEFTDVTFVVEGMEGLAARYVFDDDEGGGRKKVVKKVIIVKKKKKKVVKKDEHGNDVVVEEEESGDEEEESGGGGWPPSGAGSSERKGIKPRHMDDEDEADEVNLDEQVKAFMNYDQGLSWDAPTGGPPPLPGMGGGPPPPPPMMGGGPPPPPPMMGGPGGPPPPPPPGGGIQKPKLKLRKLNWKKLPKGQLADSVFRHLQLQGVKLDIPMLIEYFLIPDESKDKKKKKQKAEKRQVLDMKKQQFVGLLMSMLKMQIADIRSAVLNCDDEKFTEDHLKAFIKLVPGEIEVQMLEQFVGAPADVLNTLGDAERFYLALLDVPRLESRLRAMLYKRQFEFLFDRLRNDVELADSSISTIKNSKSLAQYLEYVLSIGNFLNQGTAAGNAFGFTLDSLLKLKDTKSPVKPEYTVLHYLMYFCEKKKPKLLEMPEEMAMVAKGSNDYLQSINSEYQEMKSGLLNVQRELENVNKESDASNDPFAKKMGEFHKYAKGKMQQLTSEVDQMNADQDDAVKWFQSGKDLCLPTTVIQFCRDIEMAVRQNQERDEKLKKAAERKKRGKLKQKGTGTSTKKKDLLDAKRLKKANVKDDDDEEKSGSEEYEEVIEEVSGSGSDVDEIIEEVIEEVSGSDEED